MFLRVEDNYRHLLNIFIIWGQRNGHCGYIVPGMCDSIGRKGLLLVTSAAHESNKNSQWRAVYKYDENYESWWLLYGGSHQQGVMPTICDSNLAGSTSESSSLCKV